jgi:hypothetical protein
MLLERNRDSFVELKRRGLRESRVEGLAPERRT